MYLPNLTDIRKFPNIVLTCNEFIARFLPEIHRHEVSGRRAKCLMQK
jgi:hypothetical protein